MDDDASGEVMARQDLLFQNGGLVAGLGGLGAGLGGLGAGREGHARVWDVSSCKPLESILCYPQVT